MRSVTVEVSYPRSSDPGRRKKSSEHSVQIVRSVAGDDDDGDIGDESRDRRVGDRIRREGNRRGINGATADTAVAFDLVAKITANPVFFILREKGAEEEEEEEEEEEDEKA